MSLRVSGLRPAPVRVPDQAPAAPVSTPSAPAPKPVDGFEGARPATAAPVAPAPPPSTTALALPAPKPRRGLAKFFDNLAHKFFGGWVQKPGILKPLAAEPPMAADEQALRGAISEEKLRAHVAFLADPALEGREEDSPGGIKARQYLEAQMKEIGLKPFFPDGYTQRIVTTDGSRGGANVAGFLPSTEPNPTGEYVMVMAHYDHEGPTDGKVIAGADDNISAVSSMLEMARAFATQNPQRKYDIVFVAPDAEEPPDVRTKTMGSVWMMDHSPRPPEKCRLGIALDVIGNDTSLPGRFLVLGAESSAATQQAVAAAHDEQGAEIREASVSQVEKSVLPWDRKAKSDYFGVREHGRPFLFVTAGTTPHYHDVRDTAETLSYGKMAGITRAVSSIVLNAARSDARVDFDPNATDPAADLRLLRESLPQYLETAPSNLLPSLRRKLHQNVGRVEELSRALERNGRLSPSEQHDLMGIGLDFQRALTRPDWSLAKIVFHELGNKLRWKLFGD